jgi:hypothetical protein
MPITPYLDGRTFDPGTEMVTGDAFEMALAALRISIHRIMSLQSLPGEFSRYISEARKRRPEILQK